MHKRVILIFVTSFGLLVAMASCRFHERYPLSINLQSLPSSKHTTANEGCHFRFVLERDGSLSYEGSLSRDVNGDSFGILKRELQLMFARKHGTIAPEKWTGQELVILTNGDTPVKHLWPCLVVVHQSGFWKIWIPTYPQTGRQDGERRAVIFGLPRVTRSYISKDGRMLHRPSWALPENKIARMTISKVGNARLFVVDISSPEPRSGDVQIHSARTNKKAEKLMKKFKGSGENALIYVPSDASMEELVYLVDLCVLANLGVYSGGVYIDKKPPNKSIQPTAKRRGG